MNSFNFKDELKFILLRSVPLDLTAYGISIFFMGINISVPAGLVLGNIILIFNLWHLWRSVIKAAAFAGKRKNNPMMGGYLIRSLAVCIAVMISFRFDWISTIGTLIPLFYPKVIYTLNSIVKGGK